jgi:TPR repeat protein
MLTSLLGIALACQVVDCHVELDRTYLYLKQAVYLNAPVKNALERLPSKHWSSWVILATNDVPRAQVVVGLATYHGFPLRRDKDAAFGWYRIASKLNEPFGMYLLAEWHQKEHGGSRELAMQWYQRAAELNFAVPNTAYAKSLQREHAENLKKAVAWKAKFANWFDGDTVFKIGWHSLYTQPDKKKQEELFPFIEAQAEHMHPDCTALLGLYYQEGAGVKKNPKLAYKFFQKASMLNSKLGNRLQAKELLNDPNDRSNYAKPYLLLLGAVYSGDTEAYPLLAEACLKSTVKKDHFEAVMWLEKAKNTDPHAQYLWGLCYLEGRGVIKNEARAFKEFGKSANQQSAVAMERLGYCYENGLGTRKDLAEAIKQYEQAAKLGNEDAIAALKRLSSK